MNLCIRLGWYSPLCRGGGLARERIFGGIYRRLEYGETSAEMALLFTFVLFGSSLIWNGLTIINGPTLLFAVTVLLIRPAVFLVSLAGTSLDYRSRLLIAWFGPRGLSSLLLVLLPVFAGVAGSAELFSLCCLVVLLSIALHGGSLMLLKRTVSPSTALPTGVPTLVTVAHGAAGITASNPSSIASTFTAASISADKMTVAELRELQQSGARVIPLDVRTERSYGASAWELDGAVRLSPDNAVKGAKELGLPRDAWLAAFCACPNEETSGRVAQEFRQAGWPRARALIGGWQALEDGGFSLRAHG